MNFPSEYFEIDLNGDFINDFGFYMIGYSYVYSYGSVFINYKAGYDVIINPKTDAYDSSWMVHSTIVRSYYNSYYGTTSQLIMPIVHGLEADVNVNSSQSMWSDLSYPMWMGALGVGEVISYHSPYYSIRYSWGVGDFIGEEHYIGVRFFIDGEQHYGWIRLGMSDELEPMTIVDWAYEDVPGIGIITGDAANGPRILFSGVNEAVTIALQILTINFEEEVTGFELNDISVTNGTALNLVEVIPGLEYTVEVAAASEGEVEVEIVAHAVENLSGHGNSSTKVSWMYDMTPPVVTLNSGVSGSTTDPMVTVMLEANEKIIGLEIEDFIVINGTAFNLQEIVPGTVYTVDVMHEMEGNVIVALPYGAVTDPAGHVNNVASVTYRYDDPSVTGVNNLSDAKINIYPNPASGMLFIDLENESAVRIVNMNGSVVYQMESVLKGAIDISGFDPGIYIVEVENSHTVTQQKLVIE